MTIFDSARGKVIDGAGGHGSGGLMRRSESASPHFYW
jgi:hypothetical protein